MNNSYLPPLGGAFALGGLFSSLKRCSKMHTHQRLYALFERPELVRVHETGRNRVRENGPEIAELNGSFPGQLRRVRHRAHDHCRGKRPEQT